MTTPMTEGRPPATGSDSYVVRPSRRRLRRDMAITAFAVVILGVVILTPDRADRGIALDLGLFVGVPMAIGWQARLWRRLLAADALLEIGPTGVRVNRLGRGWLTLPWSSVGTIGPSMLSRSVIVEPDHDGATGWARRWGVRVPLRFADAEPHQVLAAVHHFSGGRL